MRLAQAQLACAALSALPRPGCDAPVLAAFGVLCEERGLARAADTLAELAARSGL